MSAQLDRIHKSKVETLLGERGPKKDHAVRFRDLTEVPDEAAVRRIATDVASGLDSAVPELYVSYMFSRADLTVPEANISSAPYLLFNQTIPDLEGGGYLVAFNGIMDCLDRSNVFGSCYIVIDDVEQARSRFGIRTSGADTEFVMPISLVGIASGAGSTNVKIYAYCSHWDSDTESSGSFVLRQMKLIVSGVKR